MLDAIVEQRLPQQSTPVFAPSEVVDTLPRQDRVYLAGIARPRGIPWFAKGDVDRGSVCRGNHFAGIWNAYEATCSFPGRVSPLQHNAVQRCLAASDILCNDNSHRL